MRTKNLVLVGLIASSVLWAAPTLAQTAEKRSLTLEGAERIIAASKAKAHELNAPGGVIAVVDAGGNLMALERIDGTFAAGANISTGKARTAVLFQKPTRVFEEIINKGRTAMAALPDTFFTPLQGGVPVILNEEIIGGVGVSGASSAAQDEELAIAGAEAAKAFASPSTAASVTPTVTFFDKRQVDEGFAKGAVLFDGGDGRNYMVHASRRETPGMVEVHTKDADILYVLQGSATIVTGGTMIEGRNIAADEIRGKKSSVARRVAWSPATP